MERSRRNFFSVLCEQTGFTGQYCEQRIVCRVNTVNRGDSVELNILNGRRELDHGRSKMGTIFSQEL